MPIETVFSRTLKYLPVSLYENIPVFINPVNTALVGRYGNLS